jgi:hypothetical protein
MLFDQDILKASSKSELFGVEAVVSPFSSSCADRHNMESRYGALNGHRLSTLSTVPKAVLYHGAIVQKRVRELGAKLRSEVIRFGKVIKS